MIGQHALWAYTDKADYKELEKYGADSLSIKLTADILNALSIETKLKPKKPKTEIIPDETIQVRLGVFYGVVALFVILLFTIIYLFVAKRKRGKPESL